MRNYQELYVVTCVDLDIIHPMLRGLENTTKNGAYLVVDPTDFPAMILPERYGIRSSNFDRMIANFELHYWDPLDKRCIDFAARFDMQAEYLINPKFNLDLKTEIVSKLDERGKVKLVNLDVHGWQ